MTKLPPMATQQIDAANRITNSALHHAKIAVQVQLETTQAMLDDNIALAASISHGMASGNMQEVAQALAQAAQQNVQRYMAQSQRLAELSRMAQTEAIDAVVAQYAKSDEHSRELSKQFGMGGGDNNMLGMMQNFLKIAANSAEQFGGAMQTATDSMSHNGSGNGRAYASKPKAQASRRR
jgi:hypothetical protein